MAEITQNTSLVSYTGARGIPKDPDQLDQDIQTTLGPTTSNQAVFPSGMYLESAGTYAFPVKPNLSLVLQATAAINLHNAIASSYGTRTAFWGNRLPYKLLLDDDGTSRLQLGTTQLTGSTVVSLPKDSQLTFEFGRKAVEYGPNYSHVYSASGYYGLSAGELDGVAGPVFVWPQGPFGLRLHAGADFLDGAFGIHMDSGTSGPSILSSLTPHLTLTHKVFGYGSVGPLQLSAFLMSVDPATSSEDPNAPEGSNALGEVTSPSRGGGGNVILTLPKFRLEADFARFANTTSFEGKPVMERTQTGGTISGSVVIVPATDDKPFAINLDGGLSLYGYSESQFNSPIQNQGGLATVGLPFQYWSKRQLLGSYNTTCTPALEYRWNDENPQSLAGFLTCTVNHSMSNN